MSLNSFLIIAKWLAKLIVQFVGNFAGNFEILLGLPVAHPISQSLGILLLQAKNYLLNKLNIYRDSDLIINR